MKKKLFWIKCLRTKTWTCGSNNWAYLMLVKYNIQAKSRFGSLLLDFCSCLFTCSVKKRKRERVTIGSFSDDLIFGWTKSKSHILPEPVWVFVSTVKNVPKMSLRYHCDETRKDIWKTEEHFWPQLSQAPRLKNRKHIGVCYLTCMSFSSLGWQVVVIFNIRTTSSRAINVSSSKCQAFKINCKISTVFLTSCIIF